MGIPDFSLAGRVAIVTGGRRGIGKTIALAFAEAGADVTVCDQVMEDGQLEAVAGEIRRLGRRSLAVQTNISQRTDVDNMVQRVMDEFGTIDILVNNAAIDIRAPLLELGEDDWDKMLDTNLKGCFLCCQAAGKRMVAQKKGNIISMASQLAFKAWVNTGAYSITKAGVVMLTRVLARELGSHGIRVNAIAPGSVRTEMGRPTWSNPERLKQIESTIPLWGRLAEADDIVGPALFLASDASSYITGHTILVDAGTNA